MKLSKADRVLVEAIGSMLRDDAKLGLGQHLKSHTKAGETERGLEYLHGQIDEMFAVKAAELTYHESACQAFSKVHNYKYVDDVTFLPAMDKELTAQGIPAEERRKALDFVPQIIKELQEEKKAWAEKDYGLHPQMDEIRDASQPKQDNRFRII